MRALSSGTPMALDASSEIEAVYRRHGHVVLRRARELLRDDQEAREVVQELFVALLDDPAQYAGRSTITTWLYSATVHACLKRIRDRKTRARLLAAEVIRTDGRSAAPRAERLAAVREVLIRAPTELAQIAVYAYVDEMTHDEIARIVGCSRRQIGNLLERLRAWVREEEEGLGCEAP